MEGKSRIVTRELGRGAGEEVAVLLKEKYFLSSCKCCPEAHYNAGLCH